MPKSIPKELVRSSTIKIADEAGACYGVERALQVVQQGAKDARVPAAYAWSAYP